MLEGGDYLASLFFESLGHQVDFDKFDLFLCSSNSKLDSELQNISKPPIVSSFLYKGGGWDIGAYLFSAKKLLEYDLVLFMNSQARFKTSDALSRLLDAWTSNPSGLLGYSSSFEVTPHVRTSALAIAPKLLLEYKGRVDSRYEACVFEHSPASLTSWILTRDIPARVVYRSGVFNLDESRSIPDVFRAGDQLELLISDRHTRWFDSASPEDKHVLEQRANNIPALKFRFRTKTIAWLLKRGTRGEFLQS